MNNPDAYLLEGDCPFCHTRVGMSCSKKQALSGALVEVYSVTCNHNFTLTKEQSDRLRAHLLETAP